MNHCPWILRLIAHWPRGRGNSRNSCFRRKTLPLRSLTSTRGCCPDSGNRLHPLAIRTKTATPIAAHAYLFLRSRPALTTQTTFRGSIVAPGSAARILAQSEPHNFMFAPDRSNVTNINPLTVLIVVPSLQAGAADLGVVDLVRILAAAGNRPIVLSSGGRLEAEIAALGGEFIRADVASKNPFVMMRNAAIMRAHRPQGALRHHPRAWPRAGMERMDRVAPDRNSLRHVLVQGIPRTECLQAPLQQRDGARRPDHRGQRPARRIDQPSLRNFLGPDQRRSPGRRSAALRSGHDRAGAHRNHPPFVRRRARRETHSGDRPAVAAQRPSSRGAGRAPAEGKRLEGFRLRVRGRGSRQEPLYRRIVGSRARDQNRGRHPHDRTGRGLWRRLMRRRASWSRPPRRTKACSAPFWRRRPWRGR